jgi:hypothetical protein
MPSRDSQQLNPPHRRGENSGEAGAEAEGAEEPRRLLASESLEWRHSLFKSSWMLGISALAEKKDT